MKKYLLIGGLGIVMLCAGSLFNPAEAKTRINFNLIVPGEQIVEERVIIEEYDHPYYHRRRVRPAPRRHYRRHHGVRYYYPDYYYAPEPQIIVRRHCPMCYWD